jgi:hypothetical protein
MHSHVEQLRLMCDEDVRGIPPFQLRTRFERHLFGFAVSYARNAFGIAPTGLSRRHYEHFLERLEKLRSVNVQEKTQEINILSRTCALFEKFTSLCDSSNWSDDGQDPRIEWCRNDILDLCENLSAAKSI